eukprot:SAG31_NODE_3932_length_3739_cov_9.276099_1_plen_134_part_00
MMYHVDNDKYGDKNVSAMRQQTVTQHHQQCCKVAEDLVCACACGRGRRGRHGGVMHQIDSVRAQKEQANCTDRPSAKLRRRKIFDHEITQDGSERGYNAIRKSVMTVARHAAEQNMEGERKSQYHYDEHAAQD